MDIVSVPVIAVIVADIVNIVVISVVGVIVAAKVYFRDLFSDLKLFSRSKAKDTAWLKICGWPAKIVGLYFSIRQFLNICRACVSVRLPFVL